MNDGGRVQLTAKLRRVGPQQIQVVFLDQHETERRRRVVSGALTLPGRAPLGIEDIVTAFREQRRDQILTLLGADHQILLGKMLTTALLGDEEEQRALFKEILPNGGARGATCLDSPVHLRLHASPEDADLLLLPWRAMAFDNDALRDVGKWIFSVSAVDRTSRPLELPPDLRVLLLIPERDVANGPTGGAGHAARLQELLPHLDPALKAPGRLRHIKYAAHVLTALAEVCPAIIYWYGHAEAQGEHVRLRFDDRNALSMQDLARWIADMRVKPVLVYLNGCFTGAATLLGASRQLERHVPALVVHHTWTDAPTACATASRFFQHLLRDGREPSAALEQAAKAPEVPSGDWRCLSAAVWASYPEFIVPPARSRAPANLEELMLRLDRHTQRAEAARDIEKVVNAIRCNNVGNTRALSFLYCGSSADRVDQFADALYSYLAHELADNTMLLRLPEPLALPEDPSVPTRDAVCARLRDAVGAGAVSIGAGRDSASAGPTIIEKLRGLMHDVPHGKVPVFWLDWGAYPGHYAREVSDDEVVRWQAGLQAELLEHLPEGATAVSLLGLEVSRPAKARERIRKKLTEKKLFFGRIQIKLLRELDKVEPDELSDFFRENEARLGLSLDRSADVVQLVMKKTGGVYDKTVTLLRQAMEQGWDIFLLDETGR